MGIVGVDLLGPSQFAAFADFPEMAVVKSMEPPWATGIAFATFNEFEIVRSADVSIEGARAIEEGCGSGALLPEGKTARPTRE
jgi:hypothetical protein